MSEMSTTASAPADAGIDLSQFYQVFFEEAAENLDTMEQLLLELDVDTADDEELNAIFRCAHSIKGGAATFGFMEVADLTHKMETLLDQLRRHELQATPPMVNTLLAAGDALRSQLARRQGETGDEVDTADLLAQIQAFSTVGAIGAPAAQQEAPQPAPAEPAPALAAPDDGGRRVLELIIDAQATAAAITGVLELFTDIPELGEIEAAAEAAAGTAHRFRITTQSSADDLLDLMGFHIDRQTTQLQPWPVAAGGDDTGGSAPEAFGFFDGAPGAPAGTDAADEASAAQASGKQAAAAATPRAGSQKTHARPAASLRVPVDKIDQLINLTGELVITQTMLAQAGSVLDEAEHERLVVGLAELDRNMRDLQEAVMSIRMIPMSVVFNRFPRMLHDLADKLDKQVELVTEGEATELDKGLVEKITDPLTHLVRNSCDHGIEMPGERLAAGKPETGTITLTAAHQGGHIVIEVRDDGKGLNREKLLAKAREKGIDAPDTLSDAEVWHLIFAPGFSTAEQVTDVSGRGVGMDVVKSNILALGGSVEIDSAEGLGMRVKVRLPLTLAIMESISIGVAGECYILPLSSVVESFQPTEERIKTVAGARLVQLHGQYLPIIELERVFEVPRAPGQEALKPIMVVVESEGVQAALLVDEILGQQQVVVKNLEANFRRVEHIAAATITGEGSVALIVDVASLVRRWRR